VGSAPHDTHDYSLTGSTRSFETRLIVVRTRPLVLSSSNRPRTRTRPRTRSLIGCSQLALDIPQALQREENSRYPSYNGLSWIPSRSLYRKSQPTAFRIVSVTLNCNGSLSYNWSFGFSHSGI